MDEELAWAWLTLIILALLGWGTISHIGATNNGQHTGYVTAVEQEGLIWKTWRAYVKTDPQSSQEDSYCVKDPAMVSQLQNIEKIRALVTINYASPSLVWKWECGGEGSIISSITNQDPSTGTPSPVPFIGATTVPGEDPKEYWGYVMQTGGIGSSVIARLSAQDSSVGVGYLIPAENYVHVSFNTPGDLMWVSCKDGYTMPDVQSHTNNKIVGRYWSNGKWSNTDSPAGIEIENKLQNSITVTCQKLN